MSQKERRLLDPGWPWSHQPWTSFVWEELGERQADGCASLGWWGHRGYQSTSSQNFPWGRDGILNDEGQWAGMSPLLLQDPTFTHQLQATTKRPPSSSPISAYSSSSAPGDGYLATYNWTPRTGENILEPAFLLSFPPPTAMRLFPAALRDLGTEIDRDIPERNGLEIMDYQSFFFFF